MISMREVAEKAGVSVSTVSKVMNDYPDVSRETRERVTRTIQELDYRPNVVARSLVKRRSWTMGLFLIDALTTPFIAHLVEGLRRSLDGTGYDLLFLSPNTEDENYSFARHCMSRSVDGVAVFGIDPDEPALRELVSTNIPLVLIDSAVLGPRTGYVTSDNRQGTHIAVDHLVALGHRRIAFLSGDQRFLVGRERAEGYRTALAEHGIAHDPDLEETETYDDAGGYRAMRSILHCGVAFTAVVCSGDLMAAGALSALHEAGLRTPEDVSVVGYDDTFVAEMTLPHLTTVDQHVSAIGAKVGESLIRMIEDPQADPPQETIGVELVVRDSTAAAPQCD
ncbi:LacI family DNA-binding transcriptional regulator [Brachybacterium sp. DNPG3]